MDLYLCEYEDGCNDRTLYYFAGGGNFRDMKLFKFTYNGYWYRNDDCNAVLDGEITKDMTFEEMDKYIIGLITSGRVNETLEQWNGFKERWFGVEYEEEEEEKRVK